MRYLGFDIGGSSVKAVLIENRKIVASKTENLPENFPGLISLLVKIKNDFKKSNPKKISGAGFAFAGTLDKKREKMLNSVNIKYLNNKPLKKILSAEFKKMPVKLEHDTHCFLLAENKIGNARNLKNVFYLTLGTGIGGAFMIDGKIQKGFHGAAGEAGHMIINRKNGDDFEQIGANKFIFKKLGASPIKNKKKTDKVYKELGLNIGVGIANIINIFDPEAVILSGGIINAKIKKLIEPGIKSTVKKSVISPESKKTKILFSKMSRFGGALGAALLFEK